MLEVVEIFAESTGLIGETDKEIQWEDVLTRSTLDLAKPSKEIVTSKALYDTICSGFDVADGICLSREERFFCYGEPDSLITPLVYGE